MATVCPEDGRWVRIFPSGWRNGQPKTDPHLHADNSSEASPCIPFSQAIGLRDQCELRRGAGYFVCVPQTEREKMEYGGEGVFGI